MTQQECLERAGVAYGVIEPDGSTNWFTSWFTAELSRYEVTKSPERIAELKAVRLDALAKARAVRASKKAEIERKKIEKCAKCSYTLSMCICEGLAQAK